MGTWALLAGYAADISVGDPVRRHPVAGLGTAAAELERRLYAPTRARGALLTGLLVGGSALGAGRLARGRAILAALVLWATLGGRSLRREAARIELLLNAGRPEAARARLGALCGRDTAELSIEEIRAAVIESLAENSSDAVVAALLWAALLGPAGAAGYRAANTLDAMWGHRGERYERFGWAAARLDDGLNWLPARLTAVLAMMAAPLVGGAGAEALSAARRDAGAHPSPNVGVVEAAFAGALGLSLGGPLAYAGRREERPTLGRGRRPRRGDVTRARRLSGLVCAGALVTAAGLAR